MVRRAVSLFLWWNERTKVTREHLVLPRSMIVGMFVQPDGQ